MNPSFLYSSYPISSSMPSLMATTIDPLSPASTASEEEYGSSQSTCGGGGGDGDGSWEEEEEQIKHHIAIKQQQQPIMVKIEGEPSHHHILVKREPLSPQPQPQQTLLPPPITIKQESMTSSHPHPHPHPHLFPSYSKDDDYMQSLADDFLHNVPWNIGITPPASPSCVKNENQLYIPHDMAFPDSLAYHPTSPQSPFLSPMTSPRGTRCVSPSYLALPSSSPIMDYNLSFTLNRSPSPSYDAFAFSSGEDSDESDASQSITSTSPLQQPQSVPSQAPYVIVSPPSPVFTSTPAIISPTCRASLAAYLAASPEIPTTAYTYAPQAVETVESSRKRTYTDEEEDVTPRKKQKKHAAERDATLETGEHIHVSTVAYDKNNTIRIVRVTNPASGSAYTVIHGADVGKIVERPGNISRLYTSFTNDEKKIMKIPSDYNYAAGQKAIVLTKQGVSRLIYETKKVIAKPAYQQWLKQNILPLMD